MDQLGLFSALLGLIKSLSLQHSNSVTGFDVQSLHVRAKRE